MEGNSFVYVMAMFTRHHRGLGAGHAVKGVTQEPGRVNCLLVRDTAYTSLDGKHVDKEGLVVRLSGKSAEIELDEPVEVMTNLKMNLRDVPMELAARDFYGKVIAHTGEKRRIGVVRFTSVPPEVGGYFQALLQSAAKPSPTESS
ncbi:MAG: hypothetical protein H8D67_15630 [Deltaproteobacteria bacterium]|nr:hypothetical protein [Deltaproteobacteria bacterium]